MQSEYKAYESLLEQYQFILDASPAMLWTAEADGRLNYVNAYMTSYTGLTAEQLLGEGWYKVIHSEDEEKARQVWQKTLEEKVANCTELRFKRADGSYLWHLRSVIPYQDKQGNLLKWVGVNTDIHQQKLKEEALLENELLRQLGLKLQSEKDFSQSLLENSSDGILAFDSSGRITAWNRIMESFSGKSKESVLGKDIFQLTSLNKKQDRQVVEAIKRALQGEQILFYELDGPFGAAGSYYELSLVPLPREGHTERGVLGIVRNIWERKKKEKKQIEAQLGSQQDILSAILHSQEQERERIAEALHNGVGQILFAIKLNLQTYLSGGREKELLLRVINQVSEAISQSKIISADLAPIILRDFGLVEALKDWIQKVSTADLQINLQYLGLEQKLENALELTIFRMVQALLGMVLQEGQASVVEVLLVRKVHSLTIIVEDNGSGCDKEELLERVSNTGLKSVLDRTALLNGKVSVECNPGKGTLITIYVPLNK